MPVASPFTVISTVWRVMAVFSDNESAASGVKWERRGVRSKFRAGSVLLYLGEVARLVYAP